jgi:hypothetical protein
MTGSLHAGDRAAALRYLRTIQAGNPAAAVEVEGQFAYNVGDFSRVVQLALTNLYAPWDAGKARAVQTLIGLGFTKEGILIGQMGPFGRASFQGHIPPFPAIMDMVRYDVAGGDDLPVYALVVWGLARERRWKEVAALYDANLGLIEDVRGNDPGGSLYRVQFGPMLALSLHEVGRRKEAARLALAASRAADEIIAHGGAAPEVLVHIAAVEAVLGRKERALTLLEHAFAKNWRMDEFVVQHRIGQDPTFMTLLGNPRFERLRRIQAAHIERERRETLARGIL